MSPSTRSRCTDSASVRQLLDAVAPALVEQDHDTLIHIVRHRRTVDIGFLPLDPGEAAIDRLVCAQAPRTWHALGFVTGGTARPIGPDDDPLVGAGSRVRLALLVDRTGAAASSVRVLGAGEDPAGLDPAALDAIDEQPAGWVVDVCRRALGVTTEPPDQSVSAWLDVVWLDRLVTAVTAEPARAWRWADLAALHPIGASRQPPTPAALARRARAAAGDTSWSRLRALVAEGAPGPSIEGPAGGDALTPELAAWLDDGAFARHLIGRYPPVDVLLGVLADLLPVVVAGEVAGALADPP